MAEEFVNENIVEETPTQELETNTLESELTPIYNDGFKPTKKTYKYKDATIDIPTDKADEFKNKYPEAVEMVAFDVDGTTIDVPTDKAYEFTMKYRNAKPINYNLNPKKPQAPQQPIPTFQDNKQTVVPQQPQTEIKEPKIPTKEEVKERFDLPEDGSLFTKPDSIYENINTTFQTPDGRTVNLWDDKFGVSITTPDGITRPFNINADMQSVPADQKGNLMRFIGIQQNVVKQNNERAKVYYQKLANEGNMTDEDRMQYAKIFGSQYLNNTQGDAYNNLQQSYSDLEKSLPYYIDKGLDTSWDKQKQKQFIQQIQEQDAQRGRTVYANPFDVKTTYETSRGRIRNSVEEYKKLHENLKTKKTEVEQEIQTLNVELKKWGNMPFETKGRDAKMIEINNKLKNAYSLVESITYTRGSVSKSIMDIENYINKPTKEGANAVWHELKNMDLSNMLLIGFATPLRDIPTYQISKKKASGIPLTDDEEFALELYKLNEMVKSSTPKTSSGTITSGLLETIPYMINLALTSGSGVVLKAGVEKYLSKYVSSNLLNKAIGTALMATYQGALMGNTYGDAVEATINNPETSVWVNVLKEIPQSAMSAFVEIKSMDLLKSIAKIPTSDIGKMFAQSTKTTIGGKIDDVFSTLFQGSDEIKVLHKLFEEFGEEKVEEFNNILIFDEGSWGNFISLKSNLETFAVVALMQGGGKILKKGIQGADVLNSRKEYLKSMSQLPEQFKVNLITALNQPTPQAQQEAFSKIPLEQVTNIEDRRKIVDFLNAKASYDFTKGALMGKQQLDVAEGTVQQAMEYAQGIENADGNIVLITDKETGKKYISKAFNPETGMHIAIPYDGSEIVALSETTVDIAETIPTIEFAQAIVQNKLEELKLAQQQQEAVQDMEDVQMASDVIQQQGGSYDVGDQVTINGKQATITGSNDGRGNFMVTIETPDGIGESVIANQSMFDSEVSEQPLPETEITAENQTTDNQEVSQEVAPSGDNVSTQPQSINTEATDVNTQPTPEIPRLKDGSPDFDNMQPEMLGVELEKQFGNDRAKSILRNQIKNQREALKRLDKKKAKTINEEAKNDTEKNKIKDNIKRLETSLMGITESTAYTMKKREQPKQKVVSNDIQQISEVYQSSPKVYGRSKQMTLPNGEKVKGRFVLIEAGSAVPSHDPFTFEKTKGFPTTETGTTVNDRDYEKDEKAQGEVILQSQKLDDRAYSNPVMVTSDGIVVSGNQRTMTRIRAVEQGTDTDYTTPLREDIDMYGISQEQFDNLNNPQLVFELDETPDYTTNTFAKFNTEDKKSQSTTESAVKVSKTIKPDTISKIGDILDKHETLGDFYSDNQAIAEALTILQTDGVIRGNDVARLVKSDGVGLSDSGKEFFETLLIGSILNESAIRQIDVEGMRNVKQKIAKAIVPIVNNAKLKEYNLVAEISEAVNIVERARKNKLSVSNYISNGNIFDKNEYSDAGVFFAVLLDNSKESQFRNAIINYNTNAILAESGQMDIFSGEVTTKEQIVETLIQNADAETKQIQQKAWDAVKQNRDANAFFATGTTPTGSTDVTDVAETPTSTEAPSEVKESVGNADSSQGRLDIPKLSKEFLEIDAEISDLINKSDSLAKDGIGKESWDRYKELEQIRFQKAKNLFVGNKPDEMYDDIHDAILSDYDGFVSMPNGYTATIIASYYNSIMRYYNTIAVIKTPNNTEYLINVPTFSKVKIGTIYENTVNKIKKALEYNNKPTTPPQSISPTPETPIETKQRQKEVVADALGIESQRITEVETMLNELSDKTKKQAKTTVVRSNADAIVQMKKDKVDTALIEAFQDVVTKGHKPEAIMTNGGLYIVSSNIKDTQRAVEVWMHEQAGHYGIRLIMPDVAQRKAFFTDIYNSVGEANIRKELEEGYDKITDKAKLGEEYFGRVCEKVARQTSLNELEYGVWDKFLAKLREFISSILPSAKLSQEQIESIAKASIQNIIEVRQKTDIQARQKNADIEVKADNTNTNPTEAQKEAGNYEKGKVSIQGLQITIENPKGSVRSGTDKEGNEWFVEMNNHYGYFNGTKAKDWDKKLGKPDKIDVFIGDNPTSKKVFVIDQVDTDTREFDESKVMLGFDTIEDAELNYLLNYEAGWQGMGKITEVDIDTFKTWLNDGKRQLKPFGEYKEFKKDTPMFSIAPTKTQLRAELIDEAKKYDTVDKFIEAQENKRWRDAHSSPSFDDRSVDEKMDEGGDFSLTEVAQGFHNQPSDYFDPRVGARYYGYDDIEGQQSYTAISNIMRGIKAGKPNLTITTYRAVPKDVTEKKLVDRDWVTFSKEYAVGHGEHRFGRKEYKIIKQEVSPDELWWDGNDINEWGYDTGKTESFGMIDYKQIWEEANNKDVLFSIAPESIEDKLSRLTPLQRRQAEQSISGINKQIDENQTAINNLQKEIDKKRKSIDSRISQATQTSMFDEPTKDDYISTIADVFAPDLSQQRRAEVLKPMQKQLQALQTQYNDLVKQRRDKVNQAITQAKAQLEMDFDAMFSIAKEDDNIELLRKTKYIETGETRKDEDYEPTEPEHNQRLVMKPVFVNEWYYEENTDPIKERFNDIDSALQDLNREGDISSDSEYFEPYKTTRLFIIPTWLDSNNNQVEEMDIETYEDWAYNQKDNSFVDEYGWNGEIESMTFDSSEATARELESNVYSNINKFIDNKYDGYDIISKGNGKYRYIEIEKDGENKGSIQLRIADHTYNPSRNEMGNAFISVEISNTNKGRYSKGNYSLSFDGDNTIEEVADAVNERIRDIIDYGDYQPMFSISPTKEYKTIPKPYYDKLLVRLNKAFPNVSISTDTAEMERVLNAVEGGKQMLFVWHGSPHSFDEFSTDYMGTGEGVQAYGWGLYFTDKKSIAESYADKLRQGDVNSLTSDELWETAVSFNENEELISIYNELEKKGIAKSIGLNGLYFQILQDHDSTWIDIDGIWKLEDNNEDNLYDDYIDKINNLKDSFEKKVLEINPKTNLYAVSLHDGKTPDQYDYLRWDKPITKQQAELLNEKYDGKTTGQELYNSLSETLGGDRNASEYLLALGIDGIKYPTEYLSKGQHEETFNYVVFDENAITIENKIQFLTTPTGELYGMTHMGKVYLDGNKMNANAPIHEYGHIWADIAKKQYPEVYNHGLELIKGTEYETAVRNSGSYKDLKDEEQILNEALITAIGDRGERIVDKAIRNKFVSWLKDLFNNIRMRLGINRVADLSKFDLSKMDLSEFVKRVNLDLLGGVPISYMSSSDIAKRDADKLIIGIKGATRLDEINEATIRVDNLKVAEEMEKAGDFKWSDRTNNIILDNPFEEGVPTAEKSKQINQWIKANTDKYNPKYVKFYHSTDKNIPIEKEGLLPTSEKRRRSLQSESGYVYLANTPGRAESFGKMGNPYGTEVYEVIVPISELKADTDQLNNQRAVGNEIGNSLGESIVYGGGVRIKGKIEAWQIHKVPKQFSPAEIRLATGWERGADNMWRYEVEDGKVLVSEELGFKNLDEWLSKRDDKGFIYLKDIYDSEELYNTYPELKYIRIEIMQDKGMGLAYVSEYPNGKKYIAIGGLTEGWTLMYNLTHEIQHIVQITEGFAQGGSEELTGSYQKYHNLAGEVEARNASTRMNFTPEQRILQTLASTEDISRADQIILHDTVSDAPMFSIAPKDLEADTKMVTRTKDVVREVMQDRLLSVKILQDYVVSKGGTLTNATDTKSAVERYSSKVNGRFRIFNMQVLRPLTKFIADIEKRYKLDSYATRDYLLAKASLARHNAGTSALSEDIKDEWNIEAVKKIITDYEIKVDASDIAELWDKTNTVNDFSMKALKDAGILTKEQYDNIKAKWDFYVPLRGWDLPDEVNKQIELYTEMDRQGIARSGDTTYSEALKKAKGRKSKAYDPISTMSNIAYSSLITAEKNIAEQSMLNFIRQNKDFIEDVAFVKRTWIVKSEDGTKETEVIDRPDQSLFDAGRVTNKRNKDTREFSKYVTPQSQQAKQIEVYENGIKYVIEFKQSGVAEAIRGTNMFKMPKFWDVVMGKPTRFLSANLTGLNPDFIPVNFIRDFGYAMLTNYVNANSKISNMSIINEMGQATKAIKAFSWTDNFDETNPLHKDFMNFINNGGATGYVNMQKLEKVKKQIDRDLKVLAGSESKFEKTTRYAKAPFAQATRVIGFLGDMSELTMRYSVYRAGIKAGLSVNESVDMAKNITVNFNRKGRISGVLGSLYAFYNAALQGGNNFVTLAYQNKGRMAKVALSFMAMGALWNVAMTMLMGGNPDDDESYYNVNEFSRYNNLIIPTGGKNYIKIPLPHVFRSFFAMGQIGVEMMTGQKSFTQGLLGSMVAMLDGLSPVNLDLLSLEGEYAGSTFMRTLLPTTIQPMWDLGFNRNFFGQTITRETFDKSTPKSQLGKANVSPVVRTMAETFNAWSGGDKFKSGDVDFNPSAIEYLFESYTGGRGRFYLNLVKIGQSIFDKDIVLETKNIPIGNRFIGENRGKNWGAELKEMQSAIREDNDLMRKYYKNMDESKDFKQKYEAIAEKYDNDIVWTRDTSRNRPTPNLQAVKILDDHNKQSKLIYEDINSAESQVEKDRLYKVVSEMSKETVKKLRVYKIK